MENTSQWQPIHTAPRDGTIILLTSTQDSEVVVSGWYEDGVFDQSWYCCYDYGNKPIYPTHWMHFVKV